MANTPKIAIHPGILSGTPCVDGTRIPVYMIAEVVWEHGVDEAIALWDLTRADVITACWYAGAYGTVYLWETPDEEHALDVDVMDALGRPRYRPNPVTVDWLDRWRGWAQDAASPLWHGHVDKVPDPPRAGSSDPIGSVPGRTR